MGLLGHVAPDGEINAYSALIFLSNFWDFMHIALIPLLLKNPIRRRTPLLCRNSQGISKPLYATKKQTIVAKLPRYDSARPMHKLQSVQCNWAHIQTTEWYNTVPLFSCDQWAGPDIHRHSLDGMSSNKWLLIGWQAAQSVSLLSFVFLQARWGLWMLKQSP